MNAKDQLKVTKAGFTIIRADFENLRIKHKTGYQEWSTLEKGFKSKAALQRRVKELLEMNLIVED